MAVEVEGTSQVEEFLGILRRRAWWIAIPTIVLGALGVAVGIIVPKKHIASAQVLVRDVTGLVKESSAGAVSRMEGYVAQHIIRSDQRVSQALNKLRWPEYFEKSEEEKREYRVRLGEDLIIDLYAVQNQAGAQIVRTRFSHTDPVRAYDFLSEIVNSWKTEVQGRFESSERTQLETLKRTEDKLHADRAKVSQDLELKRRGNRIRPDVNLQGRDNSSFLASSEFGRLESVIEEIDANVEALEDLDARIALWEVQYAAAPPTRSRAQGATAEGGAAGDIQRLTSEKLALLQGIRENGWTVNSSNYKKAQFAIEAIVKSLDELRGRGDGGVPTSEVEEVNPERVELGRLLEKARNDAAMERADLERNELRREQLTERTDQLYSEHQDISVLEARFKELSEQITEFGTARAIQESQVDKIETDAGNFFEDLELPLVLTRSTTPNPYLIAGIFLLVGLALGLGISVLAELSRSTFRSARDLSRVMVVPVLGTVNRIVTRRERSRLFFARVALATVTLAVVSVVGYVTWTWVYDRDALSEPVLSAIHGMREPFL